MTLGLGKNLVGVDISATYPEKLVATLPKIGYQRTLAAEGIISLRPTVVLGSPTAGPATTIAQLRSAGVNVADHPRVQGPRRRRAEAARDRARPRRAEARRETGAPGRGPDRGREARGDARSARPKVAFLYVRGSQVQQIGGERLRRGRDDRGGRRRRRRQVDRDPGLQAAHGGVPRHGAAGRVPRSHAPGSSRSVASKGCCGFPASRRRRPGATAASCTSTTSSCSASVPARGRRSGS